MKKSKNLMRIWSLLLAMIMLFALVSCDAAKGSASEDGDYMNGSSAGNSDNMNGSAAGDGDINGSVEGTPSNPNKVPEYTYGAENEEVMGDAMLPDASDPNGDEVVPPIDIVENDFIDTSKNNVSTFSADVDTASYAYFRKLVNSGYAFEALKGSGASFRIEEFINYFKYDVPEPEENELFGVRTEIVPCPWNAQTMLFRVTLQAEQAINANGNNLVFLIDVSGSMQSADKLALLKESFAYLVDNLGGDDVVSIVTYSGREAVVLEGCNGLEKERIMNAINSLTASGSTNGQAGLTKAYQIAETYFIEGGNNRIIMASDGDLNVGMSSAEQLKAYIEEKRDQGVYLSVLGFGTGNYRDANMEALADNGNGVYYYIDGISEAEKVFGTDLFGTLYTVAEDVKLQVEFNASRVESYRLIGYENRLLANEDFEDDTKDAGEVGASHQVTVCYEIKLRKPSADGEMDDMSLSPLMMLRVRYKNSGEPISNLNEYGIGPDQISNEMSDDMKFITSVIETCMILRSSKYIGDITLSDVLETLSSLELDDPYKGEFYGLLQTLSPYFDEADHDSGIENKGKLYFSAPGDSNPLLVVDGGARLIFLSSEDKTIFDGFKSGDVVIVEHGFVMESYPEQTYISKITFVENGTFSDEEWQAIQGVMAPAERP